MKFASEKIEEFKSNLGRDKATVQTSAWSAKFPGKRAFDLLMIFPILFLLLPAIALIALAVKLDSRGPLLFRMPRVGYGNAVFHIYKFRTMKVSGIDVSGVAQTVRRDPRLTRMGQFLRATSTDELPQLFSVLIGDMSLVGVRPLTIADASHFETVDEFRDWYVKRADFPPGIVSPSKLLRKADSANATEEMIRAESQYLESRSIASELRMLAEGMARPFRAEGAY